MLLWFRCLEKHPRHGGAKGIPHNLNTKSEMTGINKMKTSCDCKSIVVAQSCSHQKLHINLTSCIFLAAFLIISSITTNPNKVQAQSLFERHFQQQLEKRIEKRRREEAKLSDSQKQQLFEKPRHWITSTHNKRLALLQAAKNCIENTENFAEGEVCRSKQKQAWQEYCEQRRQTINNERQRLGVSPVRATLPLEF